MTMAILLKACRVVLAAPSPTSKIAVAYHGPYGSECAATPEPTAVAVTPVIAYPGTPATTNAFAPRPSVDISLPRPRPANE